MKYLLLLAGLILGNYVYQGFLHEPNLAVAHERSFFQALVILCCYIIHEKPPEKPPLEMGDQ